MRLRRTSASFSHPETWLGLEGALLRASTQLKRPCWLLTGGPSYLPYVHPQRPSSGLSQHGSQLPQSAWSKARKEEATMSLLTYYLRSCTVTSTVLHRLQGQPHSLGEGTVSLGSHRWPLILPEYLDTWAPSWKMATVVSPGGAESLHIDTDGTMWQCWRKLQKWTAENRTDGRIK